MNLNQIRASDPDSSAWVCASAGTGKTKILADRVIRLLLKGAAPHRILCLTFTNAARSEMLSRVNAKFYEWAFSKDEKIAEDLFLTEGEKPSQAKIAAAKRLYRDLLDSKEKIGIFTIHSFCQKILKRFPFEAGIGPGFTVLGDIEKISVKEKLKKRFYLENPKLGDILVSRFHENSLDELFEEFLTDSLKFASINPDLIDCEAEEAEVDKINEKIRGLELKNGVKLESFLAKDGKFRTIIASGLKKISDEFSLAYEEKKEAQSLFFNKAYLKSGAVFSSLYKEYKEKRDYLDYEDLIYFTTKLLRERENRDWVLYKLDGGIDHLLLDEAQDTGAAQWEIISALVGEFYSGESSRDVNRTIFVVGDEKQSIYSFQGACLESFKKIRTEINKRFSEAGKDFKILSLDSSYRSSPKLVEAVYKVFSGTTVMGGGEKIKAVKEEKSSSIILWEPPKSRNPEEKVFWPIEAYKLKNSSYKASLASSLALFIARSLRDKTFILSSGRPAGASDFMLLVRKRNDFLDECIKNLSYLSIPVSGLDRLNLAKSLPVLDFLSVARFVLSPLDDLNLASLLKSPIIGISESALYEICAGRLEKSIWGIIKSEEKFSEWKKILEGFLLLYENYPDSSSFFHRILAVPGIKDVLVGSEGREGEDALNEFLYKVDEYSDKVSPCLQNFLYWFETESKNEIKRNIDRSDGVKITTVHSSKGLESPIIILCDDSADYFRLKKNYLWADENNLIASMGSGRNSEIFKRLKESEKEKSRKEDLRLLYVALTRAADHLIVCGYGNKKTSGEPSEDSWYSMFKKAGVAETIAPDISENLSEFGELSEISENFADRKFEGPVFSEFLKKEEKGSLEGNPVESLYELAELKDKLEYGRIFHKILEDSIKAGKIDLCLTHPLIGNLPLDKAERIKSDMAKLTSNPEFLDLGSREAKTEVAVGIEEGGEVKIIRIDLLVEKEDEIIIVDYKSDINPPEDISSIPISYIEQLDLYGRAAAALYPGKKISRRILWLSAGRFSIL